ncbi:MAG: hypothetical protein MUO23_02610 [Anaerolineales bacterium]|nr:hypothetical protein [Anaerolineales bacterium]
MPKDNRRLFETDRRMEFKLRLAAKKASAAGQATVAALELDGPPDRQVLSKLIERVRRL